MVSWNEKEINLLKELWSQKMTTQEIADEIGNGKTKNSIIGKARRLDLPNKTQRKSRVVMCAPHILEKGRANKVPFVFRKAAPSNRLPPSPIEAPKSVTEGAGIGMMQLKWNSCRGIVGYRDGQLSAAVYCGEKSKPGKSFCPYHASIFLVPPRPR